MAKKEKIKKVKVRKKEVNRSDDFFNLADAQVAVTIKNTMGLAKAAKVLGMPRPTLMASIMRLERKLDNQLFYRKQGSGEVIVTEYGKDALPHLERMLWIYEELQSKKSVDANGKEVGSFGIISTQTFLECFMAPYAVDFVSSHPLIKVSIRQNDNVLSESQKINDIFIGSSTGDSDRFTYITFHTFCQKLWASPEYLELHGRPTDLKDLKNHRLLMHKNVNQNEKLKYDSLITQLYPYFEQNNIIDVAGPRTVDVLTENGLGIMIASEETVKLSNLKLEMILPEVAGDVIELFLRVDKVFMETPIAKYAIDWIFKCRDQALKSINIKPTTKYTLFYNESSPS